MIHFFFIETRFFFSLNFEKKISNTFISKNPYMFNIESFLFMLIKCMYLSRPEIDGTTEK